jgi:hypothetical protein
MDSQCRSGSAVLNLSACSISSGSAKSYTLQQQQQQHRGQWWLLVRRTWVAICVVHK